MIIPIPPIERQQVVDFLKRFRLEWEEAVQGESLLDVYASVGLMICDIIAALDLTSDECLEALGFPLYAELGPTIREGIEAYKRLQ